MPVRGIKLGDRIHLKVSHLDWKFYVDSIKVRHILFQRNVGLCVLSFSLNSCYH